MKSRAPRSIAQATPSFAADLVDLTKARIGAMVGLVAFVGGLLASGSSAGWARALEAAAFVTALGAGASAFNQILERETDRHMPRTASRPLPGGRLRVRDAVWIALVLATVGTLGLALRFNLLAALLGLATLVVYVLVYTPFKRLSSLNTVIGAVPGAMPPMIGYAAIAGEVSGWGWYLFAVLFVWQFPHFLAIAWIYRDEYRRAGHRMLPAVAPIEGVAGRQALLYGLTIVPISILPTLRGDAGSVYAFGALALGLGYALAAAWFARRESERSARRLLVVSLFYLPALVALVLIDPGIGRS